MKITNPVILGLLDQLINTMLAMPDKKYDYSKVQYSIEKEEAVSESYYTKQHERTEATFPNTGPPEHHRGSDLLLGMERKYFNDVKDINVQIGCELGANRNALVSFYPEGGYIAWHHNADVPGRNVLFTWSENGQGSFKYRNDVTGTNVSVPDTVGWSAKSLYYYGHGNAKQTGYSYHAAETSCKRFTIAYVVSRPGDPKHTSVITKRKSDGIDLPIDILPYQVAEMFETDFEIEPDKIYDEYMYL